MSSTSTSGFSRASAEGQGGSPKKRAKFIDLGSSSKAQNSLYVQRSKDRFFLAFALIGAHESRRKAWAEAFKRGKFKKISVFNFQPLLKRFEEW